MRELSGDGRENQSAGGYLVTSYGGWRRDMVERGHVQDIRRQPARLPEKGENGRKALRPGAALGMGGWSEN